MLAGAGALLRRGDAQGALKGLLALVHQAPKCGEAFRLLGLTYQVLGDPQNAEAAVRSAVLVAKRAPLNHSTLASMLAAGGRAKEAERAFRAALAIDAGFEPAAVGLCNLFVEQGRPNDGAKVLQLLAEAPGASQAVLSAYGRALAVQGLNEEAAAVFRRAADDQPQSAGAAHNLAAVLGDAARNAESEAEARRAMSLGGDAPETWLILARALQAQARHDEAEAAYREVIARRPAHRDAHYGLAQLIWMRTGDKERATAALTSAIGAHPDALALRLVKANALSFAGDEAAAQTQLDMAMAMAPNEPGIMAATAQVAATHRPGRQGSGADRADPVPAAGRSRPAGRRGQGQSDGGRRGTREPARRRHARRQALRPTSSGPAGHGLAADGRSSLRRAL